MTAMGHREPDDPLNGLTGLIIAARAGDRESLSQLIEKSQLAVRYLATRNVPDYLQARLDASDVIQESLLEASRDFRQFRGKSTKEWRTWLSRILSNNVVECIRRHVEAEKRSISRESEGEITIIGGCGNIPVDQSSPSQRAMRAELEECISTLQFGLTAEQQQVLRLRYWEGASLTVIAAAMNISKSSVARLLQMSLRTIRDRIRKVPSPDGSDEL